ncbi:MAG: hypothetical protein EBZ50_04350 [Alphaproteobacteria bacterium]|jgi:hypothetical protein|nr:hypothetical protein [Alphaproteobacteria bacterium]
MRKAGVSAWDGMRVGVRQAMGLAFGALAIWLAVAASQAEALSALTAHAGWCISGSEGTAPNESPTFLGHCILCWSSAGAAFAAAGLLASGGRR